MSLLLRGALIAAALAAPAGPKSPAPSPAIELVGHGVTLALRAPFQVTRPPAGPAVEPDLLIGARHEGATLQNFMVAQPKPGQMNAPGTPIAGTVMRLVLPDASTRAADLGTFEPGPKLPQWQLELAGRCFLVWPAGYALEVDRPDEVSFRMVGFGERKGGRIALQGPFAKAPDIDDVAPPATEKLVRHGDAGGVPWAELAPKASGASDLHRVYFLPLGGGAVFVASAWAPADLAKAVFADADAMAKDFMVCRH